MTYLKLLAVGTAVLLMGAAPAQPSTVPETHVRGDVVALRGDALEVKSRGGGVVTLQLAGQVPVALASQADLGAIEQGAFVGATAVPQGNGLRALEVHVFPEAMRGVGEGQRPWDLRPGSTMTNATVSSAEQATGHPPPSTMTNATVAQASKQGAARKLTLQYPGGEKTVYVPPGTPVVRLEQADRSTLVPGAHVFAIASRQPDGILAAKRITVGKGGVVPPM